MRGQTSLEFLVFVSLGSLFLVMAVMFFASHIEEADELQKLSIMRGICRHASLGISSVFSAGPGTNTSADFKDSTGRINAFVFVYAENRTIIVRDEQNIVGCPLNTNKVSNGAGGEFEIRDGATLRNVDGVVLVG